MRTKREIRAILDALISKVFEHPERAGVSFDSPDAEMMCVAYNKRPHIFWLIVARIDDVHASGIGIATCDQKDTWDPGIGDRIASSKALEEIVDKMTGHEVEAHCSAGGKAVVEMLHRLYQNREVSAWIEKGKGGLTIQ